MSMVCLAAAVALGLRGAGRRAGHSQGAVAEEVGFPATRLKRLSDRLNEGVKNNELPGAVVLIARNGKLVMFNPSASRQGSQGADDQRHHLPHRLDD